MIKKLITVLAIFSLITVSASVPQQNIKNAINDFNFSITVEWDQKDMIFYEAAVAKFQAELIALSKAGMNNKEIVESVLKNIQNKKVTDDLKNILTVIDVEKMSPIEAVEFARHHVQTSQIEGANFIGRRVSRKGLLIIAVVIALTTALIITAVNLHNEREEREEAEEAAAEALRQAEEELAQAQADAVAAAEAAAAELAAAQAELAQAQAEAAAAAAVAATKLAEAQAAADTAAADAARILAETQAAADAAARVAADALAVAEAEAAAAAFAAANALAEQQAQADAAALEAARVLAQAQADAAAALAAAEDTANDAAVRHAAELAAATRAAETLALKEYYKGNSHAFETMVSHLEREVANAQANYDGVPAGDQYHIYRESFAGYLRQAQRDLDYAQSQYNYYYAICSNYLSATECSL